MEKYLLITGIPSAGKSTLADCVENSNIGLTHVPLDKYIRPVPTGTIFLNWVRDPYCIDWTLLNEHIAILQSGTVCYTPRPDWSIGGVRVSLGGALTVGPGRKMKPSEVGYAIPGTHAFSFSIQPGKALRVYVETADEVIASRLANRSVAEADAPDVIAKYLGDNPTPLRSLRAEADVIVSGNTPCTEQLAPIRAALVEGEVDA